MKLPASLEDYSRDEMEPQLRVFSLALGIAGWLDLMNLNFLTFTGS